MSKPKTISVALLKRAGACDSVVDDYEVVFGARREIPMTETLARIIGVALRRADWVADHVMTKQARDSYYARIRQIPANKEYSVQLRRKGEALFATYAPKKFKGRS